MSEKNQNTKATPMTYEILRAPRLDPSTEVIVKREEPASEAPKKSTPSKDGK